MIAYGCVTHKLNKNVMEDIYKKEANQILSINKIAIKFLPAYGNAELKKKEIKPYVTEKPFIKI